MNVVETPVSLPDKWDLVNPIGFALGVPYKHFDNVDRAARGISPQLLSKDKQLYELRVVCKLRSTIVRIIGSLRSPSAMLQEPLSNFMKKYILRDFESLDSFKSVVASPISEAWKQIDNLTARALELLPVLQEYIASEDLLTQWVSELFEFEPLSSFEELLSYSQDFMNTLRFYPYGVLVPRKYRDPMLLRDDYHLMFLLYRKHDMLLRDWKQYKGCGDCNLPSCLEQPDNREQLYLYGDLEYLKCILGDEERKVLVVDTQNTASDVAYSFLQWISQEFPSSLQEVYLFADHTSGWRWDALNFGTNYHITRVECPRILEGKSTVDPTLIGNVVKLYYQQSVESFIVMSSDCDFVPLTSMLPQAKFCFCGTRSSTSRKAIVQTTTPNSRFIQIDRLLNSMWGENIQPPVISDPIVREINSKGLDAKFFLDRVAEVCSALGRDLSPAIVRALANDMLARNTAYISRDGVLHFEEI